MGADVPQVPVFFECQCSSVSSVVVRMYRRLIFGLLFVVTSVTVTVRAQSQEIDEQKILDNRPVETKPLDTNALLAKLAEIKVFQDRGGTESVTMSPDRKLLDGFKRWGADGLEQLRKSMSDQSRDVRHHAVLLLAELPGGTDLLLDSLKDEECTVRGNILGMIGHVLRDRRFIAAAGDLIKSADKSLSAQAISVAGRTHYLKAADDLRTIMKSNDQTRSLSAAYALAQMNIPDGADMICQHARENIDIPFEQGQVIASLASSGSPDAVPYLLEMFEKGMKMTAEKDEPAGMVFTGPEHQEMLSGKAPNGAGIMLAGRSASAIASISHRQPMPMLQQGLQHPNKHVSSAALRGLAAGDPTAGNSLLNLLEAAKPNEVSIILYTLARTKDKSVVGKIKKYLDGPDHDDAVAAIAMLGDASVLDDALKMSRTGETRSKHMAIIALAALTRESPQARERITELFDAPSPPIKSAVFGWIGMGGINPELETQILLWAKKQSEPARIVLAIRALAHVGGEASLEWLRSLAQSDAANVRYTASLCLQTIKGEQQIFVRDSGEEVVVVLTAFYSAAKRRRLDHDKLDHDRHEE